MFSNATTSPKFGSRWCRVVLLTGREYHAWLPEVPLNPPQDLFEPLCLLTPRQSSTYARPVLFRMSGRPYTLCFVCFGLACVFLLANAATDPASDDPTATATDVVTATATDVVIIVGTVEGTSPAPITDEPVDTDFPTDAPTTVEPTIFVTDAPTDQPTTVVTDTPTNATTDEPTIIVTDSPTNASQPTSTMRVTNSPTNATEPTSTIRVTDAPTNATTAATTATPTVPDKKRDLVWILGSNDLDAGDAGPAQISAKLSIRPQDHQATLDDLNLLFTAIPSDLLTYQNYRTNQVLGFSASSANGTQFRMGCDGLRTKLEGVSHSDLYEKLDTYRGYYDNQYFSHWHSKDTVRDDFGPNQPVESVADVELTSADEGETLIDTIHRLSYYPPSHYNETIYIRVKITIVLWIRPTREQARLGILPVKIVICVVIKVQVVVLPCPTDIIIFPWKINFKRRLCVQPVRIRYRTHCIKYVYKEVGWWWKKRRVCVVYAYGQTGDGLQFGQPGANSQWGKVDVSFNYRAWKTINNLNFFEISTSSFGTSDEESSLLGQVNDADCIEVYFIGKFKPSSAHGGGATWGTGTVGAKVITSDEQVKCTPNTPGVDITHLAHELGHVLGLKHPGGGTASFKAGSTGTLMCPSGWKKDNPRRNSKENGNNLKQPLLKWYVSFTPKGTADCKNSATCGTCAAHAGPSC